MDELFLIILELFENFQKYFNRDKVKFALAIFLVIYLHFLVFQLNSLFVTAKTVYTFNSQNRFINNNKTMMKTDFGISNTKIYV